MARVVAIVVGVAILCAAVVGSVFFLHRHRQPSEPQRPPQQDPTAATAAQHEPQSSSHHPTTGPEVSFDEACKATRHPESCEASFATKPGRHDAIGILQHASRVSAANLKKAITMVTDIIDKAADNQNVTDAAKTCMEVLSNAQYRMLSTVDALPRGDVKDARAWMSAALVYETGCMYGLNKTAKAAPWVNSTVSHLWSLLNLTGDALSMIVSYDIFGNKTQLWSPPRTERDGFWEEVRWSAGESGLGSTRGFPNGLNANVTVCNDDGDKCDYRTVQEAVDAAPDNANEQRFLILIKHGVYNETVRVPLEKKNVAFLGEGMGKTVITGSLNVDQPGMTTYHSATVGVLGDGFMAKDLTIENTAGPKAHQAVAFRCDSDRSIMENCEFIGNQDTLCADTLRQFYKSCRIQGNVDFIFGFAAAVFQDSLVLVSPRQISPDKNVISAHGRFDPAQSTGFVFINCTVNGTDEYMELYKKNPENCINYLGRPWKKYSRTVFIQCNLGALIEAKGWMPWEGDFGLSTLYYGEFKNFGLGSNLSRREKWSSRISNEHVDRYSVQNFIQADKWIPSSSS